MRRFRRLSTRATSIRDLLDAAQADGVVLVMAERAGDGFHLIAPGRARRMVNVGIGDVPAFLAGMAYATVPPPRRLSAVLAALYPAWPYPDPSGLDGPRDE